MSIDTTTFFNAVHRTIACTPNSNRAPGGEVGRRVGEVADSIRAIEKELGEATISRQEAERVVDLLGQTLAHKAVGQDDRSFYADLIETSGADASSIRADRAASVGPELAAA